VTLTFDLLTLNFYIISDVMRLDSLQNVSEIATLNFYIISDVMRIDSLQNVSEIE